jgi:hypothetical protein
MSAYIDFIEEAICQLSDHAPSYCSGGHVTDKRPRGPKDATFDKGHAASPASSAFDFSAFDTAAKSSSGAGSTVNGSDHYQVGFGTIGSSKGVTTKTNTTNTSHSAWEFNKTNASAEQFSSLSMATQPLVQLDQPQESSSTFRSSGCLWIATVTAAISAPFILDVLTLGF